MNLGPIPTHTYRKSLAESARAPGQNGSYAPYKSHFSRWPVQAFITRYCMRLEGLIFVHLLLSLETTVVCFRIMNFYIHALVVCQAAGCYCER